MSAHANYVLAIRKKMTKISGRCKTPTVVRLFLFLSFSSSLSPSFRYLFLASRCFLWRGSPVGTPYMDFQLPSCSINRFIRSVVHSVICVISVLSTILIAPSQIPQIKTQLIARDPLDKFMIHPTGDFHLSPGVAMRLEAVMAEAMDEKNFTEPPDYTKLGKIPLQKYYQMRLSQRCGESGFKFTLRKQPTEPLFGIPPLLWKTPSRMNKEELVQVLQILDSNPHERDPLSTKGYDHSKHISAPVTEEMTIPPLASPSETYLVFVYGTLKKNFSNHSIIANAPNATYIGEGKTEGAFRLVIGGNRNVPYIIDPSATVETDGKHIHGEIYALDARAVNRVDSFEGVPIDIFKRIHTRVQVTDIANQAKKHVISRGDGNDITLTEGVVVPMHIYVLSETSESFSNFKKDLLEAQPLESYTLDHHKSYVPRSM